MLVSTSVLLPELVDQQEPKWNVIMSGANTALTDGGPAISADGRVLYISSNRGGGFGSFDLYVSTRTKLHGPEQNGQ